MNSKCLVLPGYFSVLSVVSCFAFLLSCILTVPTRFRFSGPWPLCVKNERRAHADFLPCPPFHDNYSLISPLLQIFASLLSDDASPEGFAFSAPPQLDSLVNQHLIRYNKDLFPPFGSVVAIFFSMMSPFKQLLNHRVHRELLESRDKCIHGLSSLSVTSLFSPFGSSFVFFNHACTGNLFLCALCLRPALRVEPRVQGVISCLPLRVS